MSEGDAERSVVAGGAEGVAAGFGGCGVFEVFKDADGEFGALDGGDFRDDGLGEELSGKAYFSS